MKAKLYPNYPNDKDRYDNYRAEMCKVVTSANWKYRCGICGKPFFIDVLDEHRKKEHTLLQRIFSRKIK